MVSNSNKDRVLIDVICALYLFFLAPIVIDLAKANLASSDFNFGTITLALILLVLNILEIYSVTPFLSETYFAIKDDKKRNDKALVLIFLVLMHASVTVFSNLLVLQLFGFSFIESQNVVFVAIGLMVIKEIFFIEKAFTKNPKTPLNPTSSKIVIALYSCLIFNVFWNANLAQVSDVHSPITFNLIPIGLFFAFFYYSLRLPFTFDLLVNKPTIINRLIGFLSFLLVFFSIVIKRF